MSHILPPILMNAVMPFAAAASKVLEKMRLPLIISSHTFLRQSLIVECDNQ